MLSEFRIVVGALMLFLCSSSSLAQQCDPHDAIYSPTATQECRKGMDEFRKMCMGREVDILNSGILDEHTNFGKYYPYNEIRSSKYESFNFFEGTRFSSILDQKLTNPQSEILFFLQSTILYNLIREELGSDIANLSESQLSNTERKYLGPHPLLRSMTDTFDDSVRLLKCLSSCTYRETHPTRVLSSRVFEICLNK